MDEQLVDAHVRALIELHHRLQHHATTPHDTVDSRRAGETEDTGDDGANGAGRTPTGSSSRGAGQENDTQTTTPTPFCAQAPHVDHPGAPANRQHEAGGSPADPLLAALARTIAQRDAADELTRLLIAYAREAAPHPYPLATLAKASGISPSGLRTFYAPRHLDLVHQALAEAHPHHDRDHEHARDDDQQAAPHPGPAPRDHADLATVTSLLDRLTEATHPTGTPPGRYLNEEQLRARLRQILLDND